MNEAANTNPAIDYGSVGLNGAYVGSPTMRAKAGADGGSYPYFNSAGKYMEVADNDAWSIGAGGITVVMMVWRNSSTEQNVMMEKGTVTGPALEWSIGFSVGQTTMEVRTNTLGGAAVSVTNAPGVTTGSWKLLVANFDSWVQGSLNYVWVNGTLTTPGANGNVNGNGANGGAALRIANRYVGGSAKNADAWIGHVAIIPGDLTNAQVIALSNAAVAEGWYT